MAHYPVPKFNTIAYGGNAEDIVLLRAFTSRRDGFFVDVSTGEPDRWSLTKNLVERLGWRGVNIEPLPERFRMLVDARPHDVNLQFAVGTEPGTAVFHRILATAELECGAGLSTLEPGIVAMHRATGWGVEDFDVEVVTLESILAAYAEPGFDLLRSTWRVLRRRSWPRPTCARGGPAPSWWRRRSSECHRPVHPRLCCVARLCRSASRSDNVNAGGQTPEKAQ